MLQACEDVECQSLTETERGREIKREAWRGQGSKNGERKMGREDGEGMGSGEGGGIHQLTWLRGYIVDASSSGSSCVN